MKSTLLLPALTFGLTLPLLTPVQAADDEVVARVNGEPVTAEMVEVYTAEKREQLDGKQPNPEAIMNEVIGIELLVQDAEAKGLDESENLAKQLQYYRRSVLVQLAIQDYLQKHPITDEAIQARYDKLVAAQEGKEYHARHILLETEEEAEAVIDELEDGADFAELAREKSTGPTASRGGDLGWFSPERMVAEFSDAVKDMEEGSISEAPVKTQFGWHVIKLEGVRDTSPPPLAQVRESIVSQLRNEKLSNYLESLREDAEIEEIK